MRLEGAAGVRPGAGRGWTVTPPVTASLAAVGSQPKPLTARTSATAESSRKRVAEPSTCSSGAGRGAGDGPAQYAGGLERASLDRTCMTRNVSKAAAASPLVASPILPGTSAGSVTDRT